MSLKNLHKISCVVFSRACSCGSPPQAYCAPILKKASSKQRLPAATLIGATRKFSSLQGDSSEGENKQNTGLRGKLTNMWKTYGTLAIGTYVGLYVTALGTIYVSLSNDLLNVASIGIDPIAAVNQVCDMFGTLTGSDSIPNYIRTHPRVGTAAITYVVCWFTEPLRIGLMIAMLPRLSQWFRKENPKDSEGGTMV